MRKLVLGGCVAWLSIMAVCFGGTVNIENYVSYVYTSAGGATRIPTANNWVVAIYDAVDGVIDPFGGNDNLVATVQGAAWAADGYFFSAPAWTDTGGYNVFARIYDASDFVSDASPGSATEYVNIDGGIQAMPALPLGTDTWDFDPGGTAAGGGDWQPIPEPGTLALFGIGFLTIAVRRRLRRK